MMSQQQPQGILSKTAAERVGITVVPLIMPRMLRKSLMAKWLEQASQ